MNPGVEQFLALGEQDKRDVFDASAERLDTLSTYIEKDLWVCHVLDVLYNGRPKGQPRLLFKGGTSLSKAFGAIRRFSEDIDIVVFREDLGFTGDRDPTATDLSKKKRRALADELKETASAFIRNELASTLSSLFPTCDIVEDPDDGDHLTLLVQYPSLYDKAGDGYVQPRVKIEGGARSALDPHNAQTITPYIQAELPDWSWQIDNLLTLAPERTLLEKALILHGWHCGYRDENRLPEDRHRLSRHYYDVAQMGPTEIADRAVSDTSLLENVREHNRRFFNRAWMKFEEAVPGSICLTPQDALRQKLDTDYAAMQGMILGDSPPFDEIIQEIDALEGRLNQIT